MENELCKYQIKTDLMSSFLYQMFQSFVEAINKNLSELWKIKLKKILKKIFLYLSQELKPH